MVTVPDSRTPVSTFFSRPDDGIAWSGGAGGSLRLLGRSAEACGDSTEAGEAPVKGVMERRHQEMDKELMNIEEAGRLPGCE